MMAVAVLANVTLAVATVAAPRVPFSGRLNVQLVTDSVWAHCELSAAVDEKGKGSQDISCRSDEGVSFARAKDALTVEEVARLRELLRAAQLFQGQFWGSDYRGLDASLGTLMVQDESTTAVLVCIRNESFESGPRQQLLDWLLERLRGKQRGPRK